jgi:hypothetical protein
MRDFCSIILNPVLSSIRQYPFRNAFCIDEKYYTYEETLHPTPGMNPEKLELSKEFWFKDDDEELGEDELEYDLYENKTWSITSVDYVESLVV